jgi:hypothetical protein
MLQDKDATLPNEAELVQKAARLRSGLLAVGTGMLLLLMLFLKIFFDRPYHQMTNFPFFGIP